MIRWTNEENKFYKKQKVSNTYQKGFISDDGNKEYHKVRDHCHRGAAHNICNLRYEAPKEIIVVFHNGSTYDYHFIIKELAEEFEGQFEASGGNTEKYLTFLVLIKNRTW